MGGGMSKYGVTYGSKKYKELKAAAKKSSRQRFEEFGSYDEAMRKSTAWFANPNNSNSEQWIDELKYEERDALEYYTGNGYKPINKALYTQEWNNISNSVKNTINNMERGLDKSVIYNGMTVTRAADFKIFGAGSGETMTVSQVKDFIKTHGDNGVLENKGFLSFGANNHGAPIDGSGLVIHAKVPPSVGAGAYVNPISMHPGGAENEFLFNRKSRFKFDLSSLRVDAYGNIHINCIWVGKGGKK